MSDNFSIEDVQIDAVFQINAAGTTWGSIDGNIANQTDLKNALDALSGQIDGNHSEITTISATLQTFGDIVTHNTTEFATATQGTLADSALQPNDNITELNNNAGYITGIDSTDVTAALGYTPVNPTSLATVATTGSYADLSGTPNLSAVATSGSYNDLTNKPTIGDGITTFIVNNSAIGTITANQTGAETISLNIPTSATEIGALPSDTTIEDLTTQTQQAALNSGINAATVSQISTNTSAIAVNTSVIQTLTTGKQDVLIAGSNIQINGNTISATDTTYSAGENITITNGTISALSTGYTLPTASTSVLGGIKVGNNLTIASDGTLDATDTTYAQGDGIVINNNTISVSTTIASKTDIPTVGNANLIIQRNGVGVGTFSANATSASTVNISVPTTATEIGALPSSTIIGDGQVIFEKNSTPIATISANQTATTTIDFTIPTTASDVGALPDTTTIGNGATTITVNSTAIGTITANQTTNDSVNISVPTNTNELTNGAGFITNSALTPYQLIAIPITTSSASGTIALTDNTLRGITATGNITFSLPTVTDLTVFHQIFVQFKMSTVYTVDLGLGATPHYINNIVPDLSQAGNYNLYWEYDNNNNWWKCGLLINGTGA